MNIRWALLERSSEPKNSKKPAFSNPTCPLTLNKASLTLFNSLEYYIYAGYKFTSEADRWWQAKRNMLTLELRAMTVVTLARF